MIIFREHGAAVHLTTRRIEAQFRSDDAQLILTIAEDRPEFYMDQISARPQRRIGISQLKNDFTIEIGARGLPSTGEAVRRVDLDEAELRSVVSDAQTHRMNILFTRITYLDWNGKRLAELSDNIFRQMQRGDRRNTDNKNLRHALRPNVAG